MNYESKGLHSSHLYSILFQNKISNLSVNFFRKKLNIYTVVSNRFFTTTIRLDFHTAFRFKTISLSNETFR